MVEGGFTLMRRFVIMLSLVSLGILQANANCVSDLASGVACQELKDQLQGNDGADGAQGEQGIQGIQGQPGQQGTISRDKTVAVVDTAIRLYDGKRIQFQAFNTYAIGRQHGQDVLKDGHNFMFGARIVYKLGASYEEKLLAEQNRKIEALLKLLDKRQ
jgi:hypothetical protein